MKVVILAGGFGTRLGEYTSFIPKPMVQVGGKPILWHIMKRFSHFGYDDFLLALGYKADVIKSYFLNFKSDANDLTINLKSGLVVYHKLEPTNWNVSLIDTGLSTMTGGRIKRLKEYIGNESFFLTYGDGVADIDLRALLEFHKRHGKMVTVTAVHPAARFGNLNLTDAHVSGFSEKVQTNTDWINGGFFVVEPRFLDLIDDDQTVLEREPLETAAANGELMAYKHESFWACMDTKRDKDYLEEMVSEGNPPWLP